MGIDGDPKQSEYPPWDGSLYHRFSRMGAIALRSPEAPGQIQFDWDLQVGALLVSLPSADL